PLPENTKYRVTVKPLQVELTASRGTSLRDLLFEQGVEFPCGGQGRCRGCKVRILSGRTTVNQVERERLSAREIDDGWRLACQCRVEGDLQIEMRQWDAAILTDEADFV